MLAVAAAGCGDGAAIRPGDIRSYTIPRPAESPVVAANPSATPGAEEGA